MIDWTKPIRTTIDKEPVKLIDVRVALPGWFTWRYYCFDGTPKENAPAIENYTPRPPSVKFVPDGEPRLQSHGCYMPDSMGGFTHCVGEWRDPKQFYKRIEEPND